MTPHPSGYAAHLLPKEKALLTEGEGFATRGEGYIGKIRKGRILELKRSQKEEIALRWYSELKESSNERFMPLYFDRHRYLVLMGGGGSGKSVFAGRKLLDRAVNERSHRFLVVRKVARTLRQSCIEQLLRQLSRHYPSEKYDYRSSENRIVFTSGSEILFAGLDDSEKIKSICDITGIWCEEASELSQEDFNQLDIRLRGQSEHYKQIILSFNPISVNHWLKGRFFDRCDPRARVMRSTYLDNRFLDSDARATLEGFRESDPYSYAVYCLGEWGVPGYSIFGSSLIGRRLCEVSEPAFTGVFAYDESAGALTVGALEASQDGAVKIYEHPRPDRYYVIGADTAGTGSDWSVAQVIDNSNGRQVASMRMRAGEDIFVRQLYCLGRYYLDALIAVEVNYSSYATRELARLRYPRQYMREGEDTAFSPINRFGFHTNSRTRPLIIADLVHIFSSEPELVCDRETLCEMGSFVRDENLHPAAAAGAHDDCVMALAIAHFARSQQRVSPPLRYSSLEGWSESMIEDYQNADAQGKRYLLSKYAKGQKQ